MRRPHDITLSRQTLAVLKDIWPNLAHSQLIFPTRDFLRLFLGSFFLVCSEEVQCACMFRDGVVERGATPHQFTRLNVIGNWGHGRFNLGYLAPGMAGREGR